jgi:cytochrome c oxidase subunit III
MADHVVAHDAASVYEPSLFGTYSKKIGMWLFLLSDSLTFGALLYAYSYGRISTPNWPTPFHSESIVNATIMTAFLLTSSLTMVLAVRASVHRDSKAQTLWLLATMLCVPQFASTFFTLTGMHMLHVTLGVIYLGVVALRRKFIPILLALWLVAWLATPAYSPFHYGAHVLLLGAIVCSIILWLKPKVYDSSDVEVAGLYWHFVDLVWMFIFPLVYLMSAKIL